ncbi:uncharacterized protein LOC124951033 isoform X2 [Vespa velutina]|uniref:uncharacterized protein LOC124951033 isoform X2 n=1 Tax=Vespa velutina TaxID=202808 RepID=UPI001FB3805C|nr:uncharacterized protein LOC124951033 isoform X2 [Vespa velutina]
MWLPVISILWAIVYLLRRKPNEILIEASPFLNGKASSHLFNTRESEYFTTPYETESFLMGFTQRGTRKSEEAHRALELLEDYHAKLTRPQDKALRLAIERVIRIFKSRLFQALLDLHSGIVLQRSCRCSEIERQTGSGRVTLMR